MRFWLCLLLKFLRMNKLCLFLIVWVLAGLQAWGQAAGETITILDEETGAPLPLATIIVAGKNLGTTSDAAGRVSLPATLQPNDTIVISYIGYQQIKTTYQQLTSAKVITMLPDVRMLQEVVLTADDFDLSAFMQEVADLYRQQKPKQAHIARARFERYTRIKGRYVEHTLCAGYLINFGERPEVARLALYAFLAQKTNKSYRHPSFLQYARFYRKHNYTDLPLHGEVGLNAYLYYEAVGPLSYPEKYKYQLDSTYMLGKQMVFVITFSSKPAFAIQSRNCRGQLAVVANSKNIINTEVKGDFLWSKVFFKRINGDLQYRYAYYDNKPFVVYAHTYYEAKQVEEETAIAVNWQRFDSLQINSNKELFDIKEFADNPIVFPDRTLYQFSLLNLDYQQVQQDLGFDESLWQQNQSLADKLFFNKKEESLLKVNSNKFARAKQLLRKQGYYFE